MATEIDGNEMRLVFRVVARLLDDEDGRVFLRYVARLECERAKAIVDTGIIEATKVDMLPKEFARRLCNAMMKDGVLAIRREDVDAVGNDPTSVWCPSASKVFECLVKAFSRTV